MFKKNQETIPALPVVCKISPIGLAGKELLMGRAKIRVTCTACFLINSSLHGTHCEKCSLYTEKFFPGVVDRKHCMVNLQFISPDLPTMVNISLCDPSWLLVETIPVLSEDSPRWERLE